MRGITFQLGCSMSADRNDSNEATQNCNNACNKQGVSHFLFEVFVFRYRNSTLVKNYHGTGWYYHSTTMVATDLTMVEGSSTVVVP
jgi:hypothetical protein